MSLESPGQQPVSKILSTGDFVLHPPFSEHAFRFIDDTDLLELTTVSPAESGFEEDTQRLDTPLIPPQNER